MNIEPKPAKRTASPARASEARKIAGGGRRMPGGVMPADVAESLDALVADGYAPTVSACIYRAILDARRGGGAR